MTALSLLGGPDDEGERMEAQKMTQGELCEEMERRFGPDPLKWAFVCPSCEDVATAQDFKDAGADPNRVGQECLGRWLGVLKREQPKGGYQGRGCDWSANGLFRGPMFIIMPDGKESPAFRIAEPVTANVGPPE